ncbi:MAG: pyridoxamine 5'-phosphate oxidase [Marinilabiliales bacterium]|nr:MAG: pyridoxamine 5'-phosphate oxidase [Marinilabiliales bacterium]
MLIDLFNEREDYSGEELNLRNSPKEPFLLFGDWIQTAGKLGIKDSNAMILSTTDNNRKVHSRVVLLKEFNSKGFVFFTNYQSAKGLQIEKCPDISLLFFWKELYRQIRIEGVAEKISPSESDKYFNTRPYQSRLNAIVSPQSREINDKTVLLDAAEKIKTEFGKEISRPSYWGGYRVVPYYFEFWQGQPNRLHDRIMYKKQDDHWIKKCLAP